MLEKPLQLRWRQAALALEARLRELSAQAPERLDDATIHSCYPKRNWVAAWRLKVMFRDGVVRRIDVLATVGFPTVPVRTALVDHPPPMTWPHVEGDGVLCLLPNMAECDPDDPADVAANLLNRSVRLIEELIEGSIVDRDFREEFLTYWAYRAQADASRLVSLLEPAPPSRHVHVWRGEGIEVVGDDAESLVKWVRRRFGDHVHTNLERACFIWLGQALLPGSYPETGADLRTLATSVGDNAVQALEAAAMNEPDFVVAILGALGRGGAGLIGVKVPNPKQVRSHPRAALEPLARGYRKGRTPKPVLASRFFSSAPLIRSGVQRADANWIHGRGRDERTAGLLRSTVVIFGCGSVGAPIACALAQAGVGRLVLVDHDELSWPNVGRHPLGASAVGQNKAKALAERLQVDHPHLQIEGRTCGLHQFLQTDAALLDNSDLVIAATGSWSAESALNQWHLDDGRRKPIIYAWTEAHACAGHGVVISREGGCLKCNIGRTGAPAFKVVDWPEGADANQEEPACGAHYQPYGPVELAFVTAMLSELAMDCLLQAPSQSIARIIAASPGRVAKLGGRLSDAWLASYGAPEQGLRTVERPWSATTCATCGAVG